MFTPIINDLQKGYAALRDLAGSQDTSTLSALNVSNQVLQTEVKDFKKKLLGDTRELPNGERIIAAEYELLCKLASLNGAREDRALSAVKAVKGGRIVKLTANFRGLKDISPLAGLTCLQTLELTDNEISEIDSLSALTGLERLDISNNKLTTVKALSSLTGLKILYLTVNQITDISPLSGMQALERLSLSLNLISDFTPLSEIRTLKVLFLSSNQIEDITWLSGLKALEVLQLDDNRLKDVGALLELGRLQRLDLATNPLAPDAKGVLDKLRARGTECHAPEGF